MKGKVISITYLGPGSIHKEIGRILRRIELAIDSELVQLFRGYHARATGSFVIESNVDLRPGCTYDHYRCDEIFNRLIS